MLLQPLNRANTLRSATLRKRRQEEYELNRPRRLRPGPRQQEYEIIPKSARFNMYLFQNNARKAFQIDGRDAGYLKEDFEEAKRDLYEFVEKSVAFQDMVCIDYEYGLLFTTDNNITETIGGAPDAKHILRNAGKLLEVPCTLVQNKTEWLQTPHQIAIAVDNQDVKQYMCKNDEFAKTFEHAIEEYELFRKHADEFNKQYEEDPVINISLEFRAKTEEAMQRFSPFDFLMEEEDEYNVEIIRKGDLRR